MLVYAGIGDESGRRDVDEGGRREMRRRGEKGGMGQSRRKRRME